MGRTVRGPRLVAACLPAAGAHVLAVYGPQDGLHGLGGVIHVAQLEQALLARVQRRQHPPQGIWADHLAPKDTAEVSQPLLARGTVGSLGQSR